MHQQESIKSFNVKDILGVVMRRKWMIIIPLILASVAAYGGSYLLTPEYEASTIVWMDKPSSVSRELASIIGTNRYSRESGDERRQRLRALNNEITSQTYIYQLIRELKLDQSPEVTAEATKMQADNPNFPLEKLKLDYLLQRLKDRITVSFVGTDQIRLTVTCDDPVMARDQVTKLTEIMEAEKTKYELEKILDNQNFADLQLQKKEEDYQAAIDSLTTARSRLLNVRLSDAVASEDNRREIASDKERNQNELTAAETEVTNLRQKLRTAGLAGSTLKYTEEMVRIQAEIDGQMTELASMIDRYGWSEQVVISQNVRINNNQRDLEQKIRIVTSTQFDQNTPSEKTLLTDFFLAQKEVDLLGSRLRRIESAYTQLVQRVNSVPRIRTQITELENKVEDARKYRDAFQSEEITVKILSERAKERTVYKVIEPARIPLSPSWPDRKKILVLGFMLGLVIGGVAALLAEIMDGSYRRIEEIENDLGVPVIAVIPKIEKLKIG